MLYPPGTHTRGIVASVPAPALDTTGCMTATLNSTQWLTVAEVCDHLKIAGGLRIHFQDLTAWLDGLPEAF